ncbi:hypothetical protein TTHERM_000128469 (macronuclear) [Tetrahymena thermophila SB210]|uniref:Uncharacterized protein n=1 Tax=Tetrahymena thermophila (strain SB210) TaxID=312017 RepID=W7XCR1_TETTS|nr:hypothetical protein TTHERM_000128469 [Tetrahymena thermophila SB210]EWS74328.1 hypothetical protein TTHERM_000128469 [Tetrahymena thermophila SB210]|eukprot:XP_012653149.1 hypothetical protein TTHERM_000128469 [Tetrahymena thermophila SB210]
MFSIYELIEIKFTHPQIFNYYLHIKQFQRVSKINLYLSQKLKCFIFLQFNARARTLTYPYGARIAIYHSTTIQKEGLMYVCMYVCIEPFIEFAFSNL